METPGGYVLLGSKMRPTANIGRFGSGRGTMEIPTSGGPRIQLINGVINDPL